MPISVGNGPGAVHVAGLYAPVLPQAPRPVIGAFVTNARAPQLADYLLVAGMGFFSALAPKQASATPRLIPRVQAAPQLVDLTQQPVFSKPLLGPQGPTIKQFWAAPQIADLTQQPVFFKPLPKRQGVIPPLIIAAPQLADLTQQPLFIAPSVPRQGLSVSSCATYGLHSAILYAAEAAKTVLFPSARPPPTTATVSAYVPVGQQSYSDIAPLVWASVKAGSVPNPLPRVSAAPQLADLTQQPWFYPTATPPAGSSTSSSATFGLHAATLYNAEAAKTQIWKSGTSTVVATTVMGRVVALPQFVDLTQQPSIWQSARTAIVVQSAPLAFRFNPQQSYWDAPSGVWPSTVSTGWISTSISAGPDPSEFTQPKAIFSAPIGIPVVITGPTVTPNPFVPGQVDLNLKPLFFPAATAPITGSAISSMATYGLHAAALYNAEAAKTQFFPIAGGGAVVPPVTGHGGGSGRDRRQRKELRKPAIIPATIYPVQAPDATLYEVPAPNITAILTAKQTATLAVKTAEETSVKAAQQFSVEAKDLVSQLTVLAKQKQQATLQAEADDQLAAETEAFQAMMILMLLEDE